jgi:hypothetical protein
MSATNRRILLLVLLSIAVGATLFTLAEARNQRVHQVGLGVVAPLVVSQPLTDHLNKKYGDEIDASAMGNEKEALRDLQEGRIKAVLVLDLAATTDTLIVSGTSSPALADALKARVQAVEKGNDRTLVVQHPQVTPTVTEVGVVVVVGMLAGFLFVLMISLLYGPVALDLRLGARRLWVLALGSIAMGAVLSAWLLSPGWEVILVIALVVLASAMFTLAVDSVFGWAGQAIAFLVLFLMALPQVTQLDAELLAWPMSVLHPHSIAGAGTDALVAISHGQIGLIRSLSFLVAWLVVSIGAALAARRFRSVADEEIDGGGLLERWRLRTALAVLVMAVVVTLSAQFLTTVPAPTPKADVARASSLTCMPTGPVRNLDDLNRITEGKGNPAFMGADVGAEAKLSDGRRVWVFGDTLRKPSYDGNTFVRNSMLISGDNCLDLVVPVGKGAFIPDRDAKVGYWPMSVAVVPRVGYDFIVVSAQRVQATGSGSFGFENLGPSIAVFLVQPAGIPQLLQVKDLGKDDPNRQDPAWGASLARAGDWVYLYGTAQPNEPGVFGFSLRVARARVETILDQSTWRYWDGSDWKAKSAEAVELIGATKGVSQTLSVFSLQRGGITKWYALSKSDEFLGTNLQVWEAPSPTGPFGPGQTVAQLPSDLSKGELTYMPLAHPDLLPKPGTLVVSYSRNVTDNTDLMDDPTAYRIRFLRIKLP